MDEPVKFDPFRSGHEKLYALQSEIEARVKALSDEDIYFAYWGNYETDGGFLEDAIRAEYHQRKLDKK